MKSNEYETERKYIYTTVYMIFAIVKWAFFILAVVTAAFSVGLLVLTLFRGGTIPNNLVVKISGYITSQYTESGIAALIKESGTINVAMAVIEYGLITSIHYAMLYVLYCRLMDIFVSIMVNKIFTKENVEILKKLFPLTIIIAFFKPLLLTFIASRYNMFDVSALSFANLIYIFVVFILLIIFSNGYELTKKLEKKEKQISDSIIRESELKVETIKKEELIKVLRADVKEAKKENKKEEKVEKKEVVKKEEPKKVATKQKKKKNKKTTTK